MVGSNIETDYNTSEKDSGRVSWGNWVFGTGLVVFLVGIGVGLSSLVRYVSPRESQLKEVINKAVRYAAGNDRAFSLEEKAEFIWEMGLDYVIQEGEKLNLRLSSPSEGDYIIFEIYIPSRRGYYDKIGRVSRERLEEYIRNKEKNK